MRFGLFASAGATAAAVAFGPSLLSRGQIDEAITVLVLLSLAQAWNLISGYGGQVLLGVSAFVGTGAYATTLLMVHSGLSALPALLLAGVAGALLATVVSAPLFRMRGPYFAVGSLALTLMLQAWVQNWDYAGGTQPVTLPFTGVPAQETLFRWVLVVAALATLIVWLVPRTNAGLRLMAVRDDEQAAQGAGVLVFRTKLGAFVLAGMVMGLAGGLTALQSTAIDPIGAFGLTWTINALVMTIVGGAGTVLGPAVGTFVVYYGIQTQVQGSGAWSQLLTGLLVLAVILIAPKGLWPLGRDLAARVRPSLRASSRSQLTPQGADR